MRTMFVLALLVMAPIAIAPAASAGPVDEEVEYVTDTVQSGIDWARACVQTLRLGGGLCDPW